MIDYVNCFMGTRSTSRFSHGNTLPLVQQPFGFSSFAPVTNSNRGAWFFHPDDRSFEGVRLTHQPSPWIKDHGALEMTVQTENPCLPPDQRWSGFSSQQVTPYYLKYHLTRPNATLELTPNCYGAQIRATFFDERKRYLSFLPVSGRYWYQWNQEQSTLFIKTDCMECDGAGGDQYFAYFAVRFEPGTVLDEDILIETPSGKEKGHSIFGEHTGIHLAVKQSIVHYQIATSFISYEQAVRNLHYEGICGSFDSVKEKTKAIWNEYLSRISIEGDEAFLKTFYSCMYRVFLFPHKAHEPDEQGNPIHYAPADDTCRPGVRYTDCGFWDTYRTVYPLYALIAKDEYREMVEGFVNDYLESGWLPRWTSLNAKNCMPSTLLDGVIAHGAATGILSKELLCVALEGMEKQANEASPHPALGRAGCLEYQSLGYVPCDKYKESVNLTLDAAYCDWCIGIVASCLGENKKAEYYFSKSHSYQNLFDRSQGFMVGRKADGKFREPFDPLDWGGDYTEAGAWQTSFAVPHDLDGLAALYGGKEAFLKHLDRCFAAPSDYRVGGYGKEIHEMTEFAAQGFGQCAISNQPSFHIPFLYGYFGEPEKTSYWIQQICERAFSGEDDGFPGDEDNGSMAAWFIFAALGQYPVCPGRNEFVHFNGLAKSFQFIINKKRGVFNEGKEDFGHGSGSCNDF